MNATLAKGEQDFERPEELRMGRGDHKTVRAHLRKLRLQCAGMASLDPASRAFAPLRTLDKRAWPALLTPGSHAWIASDKGRSCPLAQTRETSPLPRPMEGQR